MSQHYFDQRHAPRHVARVRVLYVSKGTPRAVDADCQNVSSDGLFVKTHLPGPQAGTQVSLLLQFNGSEEELMMEGVVRWQGAVRSLEDGTEGAGMGIQFTHMEPQVRQALERTIERLGSAS
jgi:uncharacterized protein (TIGR02266 family)